MGCQKTRGPVRSLIPACAALALLSALVPDGTPAQLRVPGTRRFATTVESLLAYPVFYHSQQVRVRGAIGSSTEGSVVTHGEASILLLGPAAAGLAADSSTVREVTGTFVDAGRLAQNDPRVNTAEVERLSQLRLGKPWPGVGELPLLAAEAIEPGNNFPAPSIRALALAPERYTDSRVSVTGRFRGRNLYGDQPDAPGRSKWDFVLQSADASIWIVGRRPAGQGFNFGVDSRVDTDKYLEVNGVVRRERHLVMLENVSIKVAKPPTETQSEPVARVPTMGPRPEVVFSTPTVDESDVSLNARVRVQFSRDLDPESLKDQVRASYLGAEAVASGVAPAPAVTFATRYDPGTRMLELQFSAPLEPYRTVKIELLGGIKATDGAALVPWTLTFTLGG